MQKVYLLLRNNRQSGPFTISELLEQQLQPSDMIWIEGKSTAWTYLSELELFPSLQGEKSVAPIKPADEIESKAEELRRRALSFPSKHPVILAAPVISHLPQEEVPEETEEEVDFIDHRKERKYSIAGELMMTILIVGLFVGGIYGSKTYFKEQSVTGRAPSLTKIVSNDQHTAARRIENNPEPASEPVITDSFTRDSIRRDSILASSELAAAKKAVKKPKQNLDSIVPPPDLMKKEEDLAVVAPVTEKEPAPISEEAITKPKDSVASQTEKKKTFGQAIKGLFKKKKKEEAVEETPQSQ